MLPEIQNRSRIECPGENTHISVSQDGKTAAVASGSSIVFVAQQQLVATWPCPKSVSDISLSPDGKHIAIASKSPNITVHECRTGKVMSTLSREGAPDFLRSDEQVRAAFYPDGKSLVSTGSKRRLYVSDVASGRWQYIMFMKYQRARCAVSPSGKHVALFGKPNAPEQSGHLTMFAVNHGLQPLWTRSHKADRDVTWGAFHQDGLQVATGGAGDGVRIWNVQNGTAVGHLTPTPDEVAVGAAFVQQSHLLVATSDGLTLFDRDTAKAVSTKTSEEEIFELRSSADANALFTRSLNTICVWTITLPETGTK